MQWDEDKDVLIMREVLGASILTHKAGSKDSGQGWQKVAETLGTIERFQVTGRGVRDRILTLQRKQKAKLNKDGKATGLGGEESLEFELLIEEIINISEDTEAKSLQETNHKREDSDSTKNAALEARKVALESMGQTRKRNFEEDCPKTMKRNRRPNSETLEFLREKMELDKESKKMEYEEKRNQNNLIMAMLHQQNQQQMYMQHQMLAVMKSLAEKKKTELIFYYFMRK